MAMQTPLLSSPTAAGKANAAQPGDLEEASLVHSLKNRALQPGALPEHSAHDQAEIDWPQAGRTGVLLLAAAGLGALAGARYARATPAAAPATYAISPQPDAVPAEYLAARPLNNSCLLPGLEIPEGPQTFDACKFVVESTDEVWNLRGDTEAAIDKYFHEDYYDAGSWGRRTVGVAELKQAVFGEMRAFPDIHIHITDCSCKGNDLDGYKCMMPDVLEGTNSGPSAWGPATNRYARWTGLVESFVKRSASGQWQYVAEWGVHDEWALIQQLGLDFSRVPHPALNSEPLHDCAPLLDLQRRPAINAVDAGILAAHV